MPSAERIRGECLRLPVRMLHRVVTSIYDDALAEHGVGMAQLNLLVAIECLGKKATSSMLSRKLLLEKSSVSRDLD